MNLHPPGSRIADRYEVTGNPLQGGMGIVYLCMYDGPGPRPVALKTFKPEYLPNRDSRDRFLREGSIWVSLGAHPHIVRCHLVLRQDDGNEDFLVLELITKPQDRENASLRSWLFRGKPLPIDQALLFTLQTARGMRHATQVIPGLVHRDLKPENLLVGADRLTNAPINRLRVTDFGLAAVLLAAGNQPAMSTGESSLASGPILYRSSDTHDIVGTPLYMAPEQWRGEEVSAATDVYALGCILVEMLTGRLAVQGDTMAALMKAHCSGMALASAEGLPAGLREFLQQCLALQPAARLGDWERVESAVMQLYEQACGQAAPAPEEPHAMARADRVVDGWSYSNIGIAYLDIDKADLARGYFEQALQVARAEEERELEGAALGNLGLAYSGLGDAKKAIEYYEQALPLRRQTGDLRGEGRDLGNLGLAYARLGELQKAIDCHEQALAIHRKVGDRRSEGATLGNLGSAYADLDDLPKAIDYHEQGLAIDRELGDRRGEGAALANLAGAYLAMGDAHKAIDAYEQVLPIDRAIGDRRSEGIVYANLGLAYDDLGDLQKAIGYHQQALAIAREVADRHSEGSALGNLAAAYAKSGDAQQAIGDYEQSLAIAREIGDDPGIAFRSYNMALLYGRQNDYPHALPLVKLAAELFAKVGRAQLAQQAQQLAARWQLEQDYATASPQDTQKAMVEFQQAGNQAQMQKVVARHPYMIHPKFMAVIEQFTATQVKSWQKPAFTRRLGWLHEIADQMGGIAKPATTGQADSPVRVPRT